MVACSAGSSGPKANGAEGAGTYGNKGVLGVERLSLKWRVQLLTSGSERPPLESRWLTGSPK